MHWSEVKAENKVKAKDSFYQVFPFSIGKFTTWRMGRTWREAFLFTTLLICSFGLLPAAFGGVPPLLNFQGRIVIGGVSYNGTGQFQFALVD
jgi:hypothetical protein